MTTSRYEAVPVIRIVAAVIVDASDRVLLVRKRGTGAFMLPGGKLVDGESAAAALQRELSEELGCDLAGDPNELGTFTAPAANEPGHLVEARIFAVTIDGDARASAEIEELVWHEPGKETRYALAPLARDHVLPLVCARRKAA